MTHKNTWVPMTTKELRIRVNSRIESLGSCHINGKWQLQVRGKDLRRLLKSDPTLVCLGRVIKRR